MSFKKQVNDAKHFYFNVWRGSEKPCPAFGGEVVKVTRAGWNHILFSPKRESLEMLRRLRLLPCAKRMIENAKIVKEYRREGEVEYWSIEEVIEKKKIRVVVRSKNGGPKHFFSVFMKKKIT